MSLFSFSSYYMNYSQCAPQSAMTNVTLVLIYQKLQVMAVVMEVTESHTLAECDDALCGASTQTV